MRGTPIVNYSLDSRLSDMERRADALSRPHLVASDVAVADVFIIRYNSDPLNVWEMTITDVPVLLCGDYIYLTFDYGYADANHEYEIRYYQELPTPATPGSYTSLYTGTLPFTEISSSYFAQEIDISAYGETLRGTHGRIQIWNRRTGSTGTYAVGKISIGGKRP